MKKQTILLAIISLFLLFVGVGCDKEDKSSDFKVKDLFHTNCKQNTRSSQQVKMEEYLQLKTVDKDYLDVQHINVEFNCCPGELIVDSTISNDTIFIHETEKEQGCKCLCKYDLKYKLGSLKYGKYHVILKKMNWTVVMFDIEFNPQTNKTIYIKNKGL